MEENNKKSINILEIISLVIALFALVLAVVAIYPSKDTSNNNSNNDNTENNETVSNGDSQTNNGNTDSIGGSNQTVKSEYTFADGTRELKTYDDSLARPGYNVSGAGTIFYPTYGTSISNDGGYGYFGIFTVKEDGTVEVLSGVKLPASIATPTGEINTYKMNLTNVKSVYSGVLSYQNGDSAVLFLHDDGTVSSIFIVGGVVNHPVFFTKNAHLIDNIDYFANYETAGAINGKVPLSAGAGTCVVTKDGKIYDIG